MSAPLGQSALFQAQLGGKVLALRTTRRVRGIFASSFWRKWQNRMTQTHVQHAPTSDAVADKDGWILTRGNYIHCAISTVK